MLKYVPVEINKRDIAIEPGTIYAGCMLDTQIGLKPRGRETPKTLDMAGRKQVIVDRNRSRSGQYTITHCNHYELFNRNLGSEILS